MIVLKKRDGNLDLLRIVSMLGIISLHFLSQSNARQILEIDHITFAIMQSYGRIACTVFFLISAWYLCDSDFKLERIIRIETAAIVYAVVSRGYAYLEGLEVEEYSFLEVIFPTLEMRLWFMAVYVEILFLMPILNCAIKNVDKRVLSKIVFIPLFVITFFTTVFRQDGRLVKEVIFFPLMYLLIGYVKRYYYNYVNKRKWLWGIVFLISYSIICVLQLSGSVPFIGEKLAYAGSYYRSRFWTLPNMICALSIFFLFLNISIKKSHLMSLIGTPTLGIYLIHQNPIFVNEIWKYTDVLCNRFKTSIISPIIICMAVIVAVYLALGIVEIVRIGIEKKIIILLNKKFKHVQIQREQT